MPTYSLDPTYFQVTWNLRSPTDYSGVATNNTSVSSGGLDSSTAWQINRIVSVTGTANVSGTPFTTGHSIIINGTSISFVAADTLATAITKINLASKITNVVANQQVAGGYITLQNAPGFEGSPFWIAAGVGTAFSILGLTAGTYSYYPSVVGAPFTSVTTGSNVTINGVNVVFTGGPLTASQVSSQMNNVSIQTGVVAAAAGPYLQLSALERMPWTINSGNAQTNMGFALGNYGGFPTTLANSTAKERANMRWVQMVSELEEVATPIDLKNIVRTGNVANVATDTITFTIGYNSPTAPYTVARTTEPDAGNVYVGTTAIRRAVARALVASITSNRNVFDPTLDNYGIGCNRPNPARIQTVLADSMDTVANITVIEQNITVTQIPGV